MRKPIQNKIRRLLSVEKIVCALFLWLALQAGLRTSYAHCAGLTLAGLFFLWQAEWARGFALLILWLVVFLLPFYCFNAFADGELLLRNRQPDSFEWKITRFVCGEAFSLLLIHLLSKKP